MTHFADSLGLWFADFYVLSAVLLALALVAVRIVRQPVHRIAIVKSTIVALALLAGLCALPGWSIVHLITAPRHESPPVPHVETPPTDRIQLKKWIVLSDGNANVGQPSDSLPAAMAVSAAGEPVSPKSDRSWLSILAAVQIAGASGVVAWLACGWLAARRLRRSALPAPAEMVAWLKETTRSNDNRLNRVQLLTSDWIDVPVALGIWQPAILLPEHWASRLPHSGSEPEVSSDNQLRSVLAHEVAHIRNRDLHWLAASRALDDPALVAAAVLVPATPHAPRPGNAGRCRGRRRDEPPAVRRTTGRLGPQRERPPHRANRLRRRFVGRAFATSAADRAIAQ